MSKTTALNRKARKKIATMCQRNNWIWCLARLEGCMVEAHDPSHRHKRDWYKGKPDHLLWSLEQWMPMCRRCHTRVEFNRELCEQVFMEVRGGETF